MSLTKDINANLPISQPTAGLQVTGSDGDGTGVELTIQVIEMTANKVESASVEKNCIVDWIDGNFLGSCSGQTATHTYIYINSLTWVGSMKHVADYCHVHVAL